jgi:hypothetical protein
MKKYLFIVLLVGVCFSQSETEKKSLENQILDIERQAKNSAYAQERKDMLIKDSLKLKKLNDDMIALKKMLEPQLSVKSKYDLKPFKIKGVSPSTTSMQWKNGKVAPERFESEIEYVVKGEFRCENGTFCTLGISWIKTNAGDTTTIEKEVVVSKSERKDSGFGSDDPFFNPFFYPFFDSKVSNKEIIDGSILISNIEGFIKAIRDVNRYSFGVNDTEVEYDQGNWKIYKKKNDELKIYSSKGDELPLILPENFIKEIIKWNDEKPN